MEIVDGDKAHDWDVWTRVITNDNHLKANGKLSNSAFKGKAFSLLTSKERKRPWTWELSGRLLSRILDLNKESVGFCHKFSVPFVGVMFQKNETLRSTGSGFSKDVYYTPIEDNNRKDIAHADFVIFDASEVVPQQVRDWLQDILVTAKPTDLDKIDVLRDSFPEGTTGGPKGLP